jgi:hypothetical protein
MAFIDFAQPMSAATSLPGFAQFQPARDMAAAFSQREWTVIRLARDDGLSSLREESEFKTFLRTVFGLERKRPYAHPRLEALRRIAVLSWRYNFNVPAREIEAFFAAGYSTDHYDLMLAHIGAERAASAKRTRR